MHTKTFVRLMTFFFLLPCILLHSSCFLLESDEKKADRFYQTGLKSLEEKKNDEVLIHFRKAIQKNLFHAKAHYRLGTFHVESNDLFLAVREFQKALIYNPDLTEAKKILKKAEDERIIISY